MRDRLAIPVFSLVLVLCVLASLLTVQNPLEIQTLTASQEPSDPAAVRLVLDAGHGGMDGGAVGVSGLLEKEVNLAVTRRTADLLTLLGVPVTLTRSEDTDLSKLPEGSEATIRERKRLDLQNRVERVNTCPHALLVSIHMNNFTQSQYSGAQVFYTTSQGNMKPLGELLQAVLVASLDPTNTRQAKTAEDDIYLLQHSQRPAILMEGGFLSNPDEEARLRSEVYRTKMAAVLASVLCTYRPDGV